MSAATPVVVWLRDDLRLDDHPALHAACTSGAPVVVLYVLEEGEDAPRPLGKSGRWWLQASLSHLDRALADLGSRLILRRGAAPDVVAEVVKTCGAGAVHVTRRYGPAARCDDAVAQRLEALGARLIAFPGALLVEPEAVATKAGTPFKIYSSYRARAAGTDPGEPLPPPTHLRAPPRWPAGDSLHAWGLQPDAAGRADALSETWAPGEAAAQARLEAFCAEGLSHYGEARDHPAMDGTSRLSPHLRFGELSPRRVMAGVGAPRDAGRKAFLDELYWREFAWHLYHHNPDMASEPLRAAFTRFPWRRQDALQARWRAGATGYRLVDAGMRELAATGWMHNRVRMTAGSFLVKHLLQPWQDGEAWFWDALVDADPAINAMNWQWVAGCGADAQPFFRIFNPERQARRFDAEKAYVRTWVTELGEGGDADAYPPPMVEHAAARQRALAAYDTMRRHQ